MTDIERQVMDVSISGKRKSSSSITSESDDEGSAPKILAKEYAIRSPTEAVIVQREEDKLTVVISGRTRPMKHWHPTLVNKAIMSIIGQYEKIKVLPSGDLAVTCKRPEQAQLLLDRDNITDSSTSIPVKTYLYRSKPYGSRAVVTGIPLEVNDDELKNSLSEYGITFLKRLKRKTAQGYEKSLSYLLCFKAEKPPVSINFGYLYLRTKPYNPPPQRCYKCNRYGHTKDKCRGKPCCPKCGGRDHDYSTCPNNTRKCVNCQGSHSAAFGGCPIYKQEAKIQILKERSNVTYSRAKEIVTQQNAERPPKLRTTTDPVTLSYSQAAQSHQMRSTSHKQPQQLATLGKEPCKQGKSSQHTSNNIHRTCSETVSESSTSLIFNPSDLVAFVTEVIQLAIAAPQTARATEVLKIVSEASEKYLGYIIEPQDLQNTPKTVIQTP